MPTLLAAVAHSKLHRTPLTHEQMSNNRVLHDTPNLVGKFFFFSNIYMEYDQHHSASWVHARMLKDWAF